MMDRTTMKRKSASEASSLLTDLSICREVAETEYDVANAVLEEALAIADRAQLHIQQLHKEICKQPTRDKNIEETFLSGGLSR